MTTADELLRVVTQAKSKTSEVINDELIIDGETRTITVPDTERLFGVEGDVNIERKHFRCPKIVGDNIDLSAHNIYIAYVFTDNQNSSFFPTVGIGVYKCEDVTVDDNDITFSWKLSGNVFEKPGFIAFKMYAKKSDDDYETVFNTTPAIGTVLMTIPYGTDEIVKRYPDVIKKLFDEIEKIKVEAVPTEVVEQAVKDYLLENPVKTTPVDDSLTKSGEAADAKIVGDELDKKINKSGWSANKFLGTNETGNIIEKDAPEGESIPNGGTTGQVLTKKSNSDKDVGWEDSTATINKASESNLGGVKVKNATEEQTVFVGIDDDGFLKVNESGTPSDYTTVKNNSEKIALDKTDTYSIADNRDEIFNSIKTSKSEHMTITDGSDYWDADEAALYPSVLSMEQIRKNRFYANMWLPNGLEIEQDYRYAANKNGHIRLYDIKTQKTDLTGIGPWGICLRSEGKDFPTSEINFIISAFRILGLNSETGK